MQPEHPVWTQTGKAWGWQQWASISEGNHMRQEEGGTMVATSEGAVIKVGEVWAATLNAEIPEMKDLIFAEKGSSLR